MVSSQVPDDVRFAAKRLGEWAREEAERLRLAGYRGLRLMFMDLIAGICEMFLGGMVE